MTGKEKSLSNGWLFLKDTISRINNFAFGGPFNKAVVTITIYARVFVLCFQGTFITFINEHNYIANAISEDVNMIFMISSPVQILNI